MLLTVDEIAHDVVSRMDRGARAAVANDFPSHTAGERIWCKTQLMTDIRNEYNLWWDHPLTEKWRTDESSRDIRDGVDFSEDHPDNISSVIYKRIEEILRTTPSV